MEFSFWQTDPFPPVAGGIEWSHYISRVRAGACAWNTCGRCFWIETIYPDAAEYVSESGGPTFRVLEAPPRAQAGGKDRAKWDLLIKSPGGLRGHYLTHWGTLNCAYCRELEKMFPEETAALRKRSIPTSSRVPGNEALLGTLHAALTLYTKGFYI
jgi:hypothetical protein